MAKRRRNKSSGFLSIPFLGGVLVVLVMLGFFIVNMQNPDVKSATDFKPPVIISNTIKASDSATKCTARVIAFSLSGVCTDNNDRGKFTTASYTCSDGTQGSITKNCFNAGDAFAKANIACVKSSCPLPSTTAVPLKTPNTTLPPHPTTNSGKH